MKHWIYGGSGLALGMVIAFVAYYKASVEQLVHGTAGTLYDNMSFYRMVESGRPNDVNATIQISFNSLYCQARYYDELPFIDTSYSEDLLMRADEFRREELQTFPDNERLTQMELDCIFN